MFLSTFWNIFFKQFGDINIAQAGYSPTVGELCSIRVMCPRSSDSQNMRPKFRTKSEQMPCWRIELGMTCENDRTFSYIFRLNRLHDDIYEPIQPRNPGQSAFLQWAISILQSGRFWVPPFRMCFGGFEHEANLPGSVFAAVFSEEAVAHTHTVLCKTNSSSLLASENCGM